VLGGLIPLILLGIIVLMGSYMDDRIRNTLAMVSSLLLLVQVFSMRWNVVVGGQMFSKSMRGFRETYVPGMFEKEGVLAAVVIFAIPFVLLVIFDRLIPTFSRPAVVDSEPSPTLSEG
jgi:predicted membrane protein